MKIVIMQLQCGILVFFFQKYLLKSNKMLIRFYDINVIKTCKLTWIKFAFLNILQLQHSKQYLIQTQRNACVFFLKQKKVLYIQNETVIKTYELKPSFDIYFFFHMCNTTIFCFYPFIILNKIRFINNI